MLTYILKRILLLLPTLLGALTITFVVIQFVPGGPVEQMMAEARASDGGDAAGYAHADELLQDLRTSVTGKCWSTLRASISGEASCITRKSGP